MTLRPPVLSEIDLFKIKPTTAQTELFDTLLNCRNVTIERIQSPPNTQSGPYLQEQDEWVCLLQGEAKMELDGKLLTLHTGESLFIPGQTPHRVVATSNDPVCIWLAVHILP